jgi:hypothetical protein
MDVPPEILGVIVSFMDPLSAIVLHFTLRTKGVRTSISDILHLDVSCLGRYSPQFNKMFIKRIDESMIMSEAIKAQNLPLMKYLHDKYPKIDFTKSLAAQTGNIEILKWLIAINKLPANVSWHVAYSGNIDALEFIADAGYELNERTAFAAATQSLTMLQWLRNRNCPWDQDVYYNAALGGHLDILNWALDHRCPIANKPKWLFGAAISSKRLDIVQWAFDRNSRWDSHAFDILGTSGTQEIIRFCIEKGCMISNEVYATMAQKKEFAFIKELYELLPNLALHSNIIMFAILESNDDMFYLALERNCPFGYAMGTAIQMKRIDLMEALHKHGAIAPICPDVRDPLIKTWLIEHGFL